MNRQLIAALSLAAATLGTTAAAEAEDGKMHSAAQCVLDTRYADTLDIWEHGVSARGEDPLGETRVICPVMKDDEDGSVDASARFTWKDNHAQGAVSCALSVRDFYSYLSWNTVSSTTSSTVQEQQTARVHARDHGDYFSVECRLPLSSGINEAWLHSYGITEW